MPSCYGFSQTHLSVAETAGSSDFDATRTALRAAWFKQLSAIRSGGGTPDRQTAFHTALYHAVMHPNVAGDVDGRDIGFDNIVYTS